MKIRHSTILLLFVMAFLFAMCKENNIVTPPVDERILVPFENNDVRLDLAGENCPQNIIRLYFFTEWEGICLTREGYMYRTNTRGNKWAFVEQGNAAFFINDLRLSDDKKTVFASGFQYGTNNSVISKSSDRGVSWTTLHTLPNSATKNLTLGNNNVIYALNHRNADTTFTILKSETGGQSWETVSTFQGVTPYPQYLAYVSSSKLYMNTLSTLGTFLSDNGGRTWQVSNTTMLDNSTIFVNGVGYAIKSLPTQSQLLVSTDNGDSWRLTYTGQNYFYNRIRVVTPSIIFLFGQNKPNINDGYLNKAGFSYTFDGGTTWKDAQFGNKDNILSISSFYDDKHGYVIDGTKIYYITIK